jgi:parallel beta helix pectate lyase-like protein
MRPFLLMVMLLLGSNTYLMAAAGCCKCIPIKQKCKNNIPTPSVFTITNSGNYALKGDFKGSIVIAASDVTLDLCGFKVTGIDPAKAAIASKGSFNNITIKNGSVTNPSGLGIGVANSTGIVLENLDIFGSSQALTMTNCKSSQVTTLNAYQNTNTAGAVVTLSGSDTIQLTQVQANNNTTAFATSPVKAIARRAKKNVSSSATPLQVPAIILLFESSNVTLTECTANFNNCTRDSGFGQFFVVLCQSVSLINCQANDNQISIADTQGFAPIIFELCTDAVIDSCQANRNLIPKSTTQFLRPIFVLASNRTIIKNSQANDNSVQSLVTNGSLNQDLSGIMVLDSDPVISHCQISGNRVEDGGFKRGLKLGFGLLNGIFVKGIAGSPNRSVIEYCQVNDNSMGTNRRKQFVLGINITASEDLTIGNCSADGNNGGFMGWGILVNDGSALSVNGATIGPIRNIKIVNSTASNNSSGNTTYGIQFMGSPANPVQSSEIIGCQTNRNGKKNPNTSAFGIEFFNVLGCSVIECQMDGQLGFGVGFSASSSAPAFVSTDCSIIKCSAKENFIGFRINGSVNNLNQNFLLKDNIAIGNLEFGFHDLSTTMTSRYLGNFASNSVNFSFPEIAPTPASNPIQIFFLNSMGVYTHLSGDPAHFSALTNISQIP